MFALLYSRWLFYLFLSTVKGALQYFSYEKDITYSKKKFFHYLDFHRFLPQCELCAQGSFILCMFVWLPFAPCLFILYVIFPCLSARAPPWTRFLSAAWLLFLWASRKCATHPVHDTPESDTQAAQTYTSITHAQMKRHPSCSSGQAFSKTDSQIYLVRRVYGHKRG